MAIRAMSAVSTKSISGTWLAPSPTTEAQWEGVSGNRHITSEQPGSHCMVLQKATPSLHPQIQRVLTTFVTLPFHMRKLRNVPKGIQQIWA